MLNAKSDVGYNSNFKLLNAHPRLQPKRGLNQHQDMCKDMNASLMKYSVKIQKVLLTFLIYNVNDSRTGKKDRNKSSAIRFCKAA